MPTLFAPAKINITLEILARRPDGYHEIRSLLAPVGIFDRIELEAAAQTRVETNVPGLEDDNLVTRALRTAGVAASWHVRLEKHIPIGGGLGGGSSDAASILLATRNGELGTVRSHDWVTMARSLGSDVPFFLTQTAAVIEGTGERVTPAARLPAWWVVVVRPTVAVATADAYARLAASRPAGPPNRPRAASATVLALQALEAGDFVALQRQLLNDFHDLILDAYPVIAKAHAAMVAAGTARALLSGSGSCLFALFETEEAARTLAGRLVPDETIAQIFVAPLTAHTSARCSR
ncbi:MAG TPA: 4-(cytidine 5'-diphospho)-2-C-methyl-D-erythritol kinase [Candidatus Acidoferrales bacterium]|nr:4-(cytidine 5'-diphospho)-2-C-methyl-D-erythritol kinase [Candidatus Acidoferrales bacterium]